MVFTFRNSFGCFFLVFFAIIGASLCQMHQQPPPQQQQQQQQYQQQPGHNQQYQQPPPVQQQQQYQQPPPAGQQQQYQQQPPPVQQQQQFQQQQQPPQGQGHKFGDGQEIHDQQHIKSHLDGQINTNQQMSNEQLQFHYFKMHDSNNDNMLDGVELIKAITHWHGDDKQAPPKLTEPELEDMIDTILRDDDFNHDGFIDYGEFLKSQAGRA